MRYYYRILFIAIIMEVAGCRDMNHAEDLEVIAELANSRPDSALTLLHSVDANRLDSKDRHYYDFLTIKVNDKNYIFHTSDSLILDFIQYAERHETPAIIDEAYYYAGRVYSDLHDYPTSIKYFQRALDNLPKDSINSDLHGRILSQTGRLLLTMRLTKDAIDYLIAEQKAIRYLNDTIGKIHNLHLLRSSYLRMDNGDSALICASEALELCPENNIHLKAKSRMLLAETFRLTGRNDTALKLIRNAPEQVKSVSRNWAWSIAAKIYQRAGLPDTAWMYVHRLISSPDSLNKQNGYRLIFSTSLAERVPRDSLAAYLVDYHNLLEAFYNKNNVEEAILQNTIYNYTLHDRARTAAEGESRNRLTWIIVLAGIAAVLLLTSLVLFEKQKRRRLELEIARSKVRQLEDAMQPQVVNSRSRQELIDTLRNTCEKGLRIPLDSGIKASPQYYELRRRIDGNIRMCDDDQYWSAMEEMVSERFPQFKNTLITLTDNTLTSLDWHVALMIKCRINQSEMGRLLGVGRSAVSHRLNTLGRKIFGDPVNTRMVKGSILLI